MPRWTIYYIPLTFILITMDKGAKSISMQYFKSSFGVSKMARLLLTYPSGAGVVGDFDPVVLGVGPLEYGCKAFLRIFSFDNRSNSCHN